MVLTYRFDDIKRESSSINDDPEENQRRATLQNKEFLQRMTSMLKFI